MKRKYRQGRYAVRAYLMKAIEVLKPPDELSVSEWAERHRVLDARSSAMPGPWKNAVTPYLRGIMDEFSNYRTEEIIFVKPTQSGGTESLLNQLGYIVDQDPAPCMIVYPTDELAESVSENRLRPMIEASPTLAAKYDRRNSDLLELQFLGMYASLTGANSPSGLASKPIRFLLLDEVDKYPPASRREADPISLARERTKTFSNRKIYMCSTPTLRTGPIWRALEAADVERHYFVPCPHCGEYIELIMPQLKWPGKETGQTYAERAEGAIYICQRCGAVINDRDKPGMLMKGEWRDVRGSSALATRVAFRMNTLYSPFVRFRDVAREFMLSKADPERLQNFINSWLAEPWEDTRVRTSEELVSERRTELPSLIVPSWTKLLTAGVDVQEQSLYYTIRAWGDWLTSQNIAHGQVLSFDDIERVMNTEYPDETGKKLLVNLCLVDSGYRTDEVYEFCVKNAEWALPSKGVEQQLAHYRLSVVNKEASTANRLTLVIIDTNKYKDLIAARMGKENGTGSWMVASDCDAEYMRQVTSEQKVSVRTSGGEKLVWKQKVSHAPNHYLDCEVGSAAAADILGIRSTYLENGVEEGKQERKPPDVQEDSGGWIKAGGDWLKK